MSGQPTGYRIRTSDPEARDSDVTKVRNIEPDAEEEFIERVVTEVLRRLDARNEAKAAPDVEPDPYFQVKRNPATRPMSEY